MILKLLKFDLEINFLPGKDMFLADALFWAFIKGKVSDDPDMLYTVYSIPEHLPMSEHRVN